MLSSRFRAMYRNLGLSRLEVAKLLHVTERTLHNWDTGHHEIPYSAYRLLRLLTRQELPGKAWAGWHITAGVLWSPEGYGFKPQDLNWWSMLCRRSAQFHFLYEENSRLRHAAQSAAQPAILSTETRDEPVTRHFSLTGETFHENLPHCEMPKCPADTRFMRVRFGQNLLKGGV